MTARLTVVELTPPGRGAVATLLVEGPDAAAAVQSRFQAADGRPLSAHPEDRLVFGRFDFGSSSREEVVVRRRSDESVELNCHGGHAAVAALTDALVEQGCRAVRWQDWVVEHGTYVLSLRPNDPITVAAHLALAQARTERTAAILLDQLGGALRRAVDAVRRGLNQGDTASARLQLETLLARAPLGRHLVEPWRVVLAGPPNVGKSSLINALVGYSRVIVHSTPGTTRDVVSATTALEGWSVELSDTAGLWQGREAIERAGIAMARQKLAAADLVVLVFDSTQPFSTADRNLAERLPNAVLVQNKCDLPTAPGGSRAPGLWTSALTGKGVEPLVQAIVQQLVPNVPPPGAAVPFTEAQVDSLRSAAEALRRHQTTAAKEILARI